MMANKPHSWNGPNTLSTCTWTARPSSELNSRMAGLLEAVAEASREVAGVETECHRQRQRVQGMEDAEQSTRNRLAVLSRQVQADKASLKVIYTSGYSSDIVGRDFVLREGLNYLQKPFVPQKLARAVRKCLDGK